jgi:signal peptidase I
MRSGRPFHALSAALLLVLLGAAWIVFAPIQFGGHAAYVIVNGISMEPGFHRGDLAILQQAPDYQVGDIVTYRHPQIGPIIHRIIALDGDRYIFKGDNNSWIDGYRPTQAECIGKLWIYIPSAGSFIEQLRIPRNMAILAAVLGFMIMTTITRGSDRRQVRPARKRPFLTIRFVMGRRPERRATRQDIGRASHAQPRAIAISGQSKETLFFALAALAFAALLLGAFAFTRPISRSVSDDLSYEHTGAFSYSAAAPAGVYDSGGVQTGEPVFRQLTSAVAVQFTYHLTADQPTDLHGSARLIAEISHTSGWKREIELQPETAFNGGDFTASGSIDLAHLQALTDSFEKQTGLQSQPYTLAVVSRVAMQGALNGQELRDEFAPRLEFQLDRLQMQLVKDSGHTSGPLNPSQKGLLKHSRPQPNTLALLGLVLEVASARWIALTALAAAAGGWLLLAMLVSRAARVDEPTRIRLKYGPLLIAIRDSDLGTAGSVVDVATIDDLARLAEQHGQMILHAERAGRHRYVVHDGNLTYRYQIADLDDSLPASTEQGIP